MPFCSTAVVSHTRPLATTGVDQPSPATGDFQTMFLVSLHSSGSPRSAEWPCAPGPRNSGHSSFVATDGKSCAAARLVHTISVVTTIGTASNRLVRKGMRTQSLQ